MAEKGTIGDAIDAAAPAIDVLRGQHKQLIQMLVDLDKLGSVGTRVVNETKDDLVAELRHLEPVLRKLADTGDSLVPGLVAVASYPFPIEAADVIHGDFANVVFKMQIKLTPVSEGGLLPTTLNDLVTLCRGTPLAPICAPASGAVDQLCTLLGSLPLCKQTAAADVSAALRRVERESGTGPTKDAAAGPPPTGFVPSAPTVAPDIVGGLDPSLVQRLIGGLLGGGSR